MKKLQESQMGWISLLRNLLFCRARNENLYIKFGVRLQGGKKYFRTSSFYFYTEISRSISEQNRQNQSKIIIKLIRSADSSLCTPFFIKKQAILTLFKVLRDWNITYYRL